MPLRDASILKRKSHLIQLVLNRLLQKTTEMSISSSVPGKQICAISHMRATNDKAENLKQVKNIVERAKDLSSSFVFIPECCDFVGQNRKETLELSEPLSGPTVAAYKDLAKSYNIWLSFGGVHEAILHDGKKTDKIHNAHIVIDNNGDIIAVYRKLHLFDVDTPEFRFRESDVVADGYEIVEPINTPIGNLGLQICYDVRFPEVSTILRKLGAQILTYPSAFAYSTGKAHWEVLLRARAIENQCFVIAPAQIGFHNAKRQSYGHAMIIDPWGKILATCSNDSDVDIATAEIDLDALIQVRKSMPCFSHRRHDIYSLHSLNITPNKVARTPDDTDENQKFGGHIIPSKTIFLQSQHSYGFTNIRCVVPGHVLVASKRSVERLKDLTSEEVTDFFHMVCRVQRITEKIYKTTSSTVTVQDGEHAGQTVKHVHCHIMPRRNGDFEHNDQIYIELNKHDHGVVESPRRSIDEMIQEAEVYKEFVKNHNLI